MNTVFYMANAPVPLLPVTVSAGFPSPAAAYAAKPLLLDDWLWPARASSYLVPQCSTGHTYLVLDRALSPVVGDLVWFPGLEAPLVWPVASRCESAAGGDVVGLVVAATVRLFRRRADPGTEPASIHSWIVQRPHSTYLVRAQGRSMLGLGIHHGSLLVVDRGVELRDRDIVIAGCADGFLVKQYRDRPPRLVAANPEYPDIVLSRAPEYDLDGVVIASLTKYRGEP